MNRIILIGNGFDLAHGYPTRYEDFIDWYWNKRVDSFNGNLTPVSEDSLCTIKISSKNTYNCWNVFAFNLPRFLHKLSGQEVIQNLKNAPELYEFTVSPFFKCICESIETKGWVDIERVYYNHVKICFNATNQSDDNAISIEQLNHQLEYLRKLLIEYLKSLQYHNQGNEDISNIIYGAFNPDDISVSSLDAYNTHCEIYGTIIPDGKDAEVKFGNKRFSNPCKVLLLNFNYTPIAIAYLLIQIEELKYGGDIKAEINFIHGDITKPRTLIFGYGDELDDTYNSLLKIEENEYLRFIKSIKYLETDNYYCCPIKLK